MKQSVKRRLAIYLLATAVLVSLILVSSVKALTLNFSDSTWANLTATGPSLTKAGNTEIYTITGRLSANTSGAVHIRLWLMNASQVYKVILDDDALEAGNYLAGSSFAKSYNVIIPADADNNKYIYATVDAGTRHLTNFTLTLVQNPTYTDLQIQLSQSQAQAANLTSQLNNMQNSSSGFQDQLGTLQDEKAALILELDNLKGNNTELQTQVESLQANNTLLEREILDIQTLLSGFQNSTSVPQAGNTAELQSVIGRLSNQTLTLQAQLGDVEASSGTKSLIMYVTIAVAAAMSAVVGVLVLKLRKKNVPPPPAHPRR